MADPKKPKAKAAGKGVSLSMVESAIIEASVTLAGIREAIEHLADLKDEQLRQVKYIRLARIAERWDATQQDTEKSLESADITPIGVTGAGGGKKVYRLDQVQRYEAIKEQESREQKKPTPKKGKKK